MGIHFAREDIPKGRTLAVVPHVVLALALLEYIKRGKPDDPTVFDFTKISILMQSIIDYNSPLKLELAKAGIKEIKAFIHEVLEGKLIKAHKYDVEKQDLWHRLQRKFARSL